MKSCKGQSVKHIISSCSKHGNMIIPKWSPKLDTKTSKKTFYQQNGMHTTTQNIV